MSKVILSAKGLPGLPQGEFLDHVVPGLYFVSGARRKSWLLRWRASGKQNKKVLGYFVANAPEASASMGLADARQAARDTLARAEMGVPVEQAPKAIHPKDALTVETLLNNYEKMRIAKGEKIKSLPLAMRTLRNDLKPHFNIPAAMFGKAELRGVRDKIHARAPHQASAFLRYAGPVWRWASAEDLVPFNPVPDVLKIQPVTKRKRILTHAEIRKIWKAAGQMEGTRGDAAKNYGRMVRFLLVTGQRRDEAASLLYGDILDGRWKIEEDATKSAREQRLKLPALALDVIGKGEARKLVFEGVSGGKISGFSRLKADLDTACGVSKWRHHDLRRTVASEMQELGIDHMTIEGILNHAIPGVAGVYMRASLDKAKADALEKWATRLSKILAGAAIASK